MRSLTSFIVKAKSPLQDKMVHGSLELLTPEFVTKFNEIGNINWETEIIAVPEKFETEAEVGDTLICHHNVLINKKNQQNSSGVQTNRFCIDEEEDLYQVPYEPIGRNNLAYVIVKPNGDIKCLGDIILCEPVVYEKDYERDSGIVVKDDYERVGSKLECKVVHSNEHSRNRGISEGDVVGLDRDSDYKIEVNGKQYWRIFDADVVYIESFDKPHKDFVVVEIDEKEDMYSETIEMAQQLQTRNRYGNVMSKGLDCLEIKGGERVVVGSIARLFVINEDKRLYYTREKNILGVIE